MKVAYFFFLIYAIFVWSIHLSICDNEIYILKQKSPLGVSCRKKHIIWALICRQRYTLKLNLKTFALYILACMSANVYVNDFWCISISQPPVIGMYGKLHSMLWTVDFAINYTIFRNFFPITEKNLIKTTILCRNAISILYISSLVFFIFKYNYVDYYKR